VKTLNKHGHDLILVISHNSNFSTEITAWRSTRTTFK